MCFLDNVRDPALVQNTLLIRNQKNVGQVILPHADMLRSTHHVNKEELFISIQDTVQVVHRVIMEDRACASATEPEDGVKHQLLEAATLHTGRQHHVTWRHTVTERHASQTGRRRRGTQIGTEVRKCRSCPDTERCSSAMLVTGDIS